MPIVLEILPSLEECGPVPAPPTTQSIKVKYRFQISLRLEAKKTHNFDRNPKRGALSKKEEPKTAENKTDQMYVAFGPLTSSFSVEQDFCSYVLLCVNSVRIVNQQNSGTQQEFLKDYIL